MTKLIRIIVKIFQNLFFFRKKQGFEIAGSKDEYLEIFKNAKSKIYPMIDNFEKKMGYSIDKKWLDDLALITQVSIKKSEINYQHGRVLYSSLKKYLKNFDDKNLTIFETGTARGFSSVCMSKALKEENMNGEIHTIDILPNNKKIYWNCITDHEVGRTTRIELLSNYSELTKNIHFHNMKSIEFTKNFNLKRINFAFLDAEHNEENIKFEYEYVMNRQFKNDIIIFDDYDDKYESLKKYLNQVLTKKYITKIISGSDNRHYLYCSKI